MSDPLDQFCINTIRFLSVDAVQQATPSVAIRRVLKSLPGHSGRVSPMQWAWPSPRRNWRRVTIAPAMR